MSRPGEIVDRDPDRALSFEGARTALTELLSGKLKVQDPICSTAVAGLPSKPVIDAIGILAGGATARDCAPLPRRQRHEARRAAGIPGRTCFGRDRHRLLFYPAGHRGIARHLRCRDILRTHPDTAKACAALKRRLQMRVGEDWHGCAGAKTPFRRRHRKAVARGFGLRETRAAQGPLGARPGGAAQFQGGKALHHAPVGTDGRPPPDRPLPDTRHRGRRGAAAGLEVVLQALQPICDEEAGAAAFEVEWEATMKWARR
ncbi:GrpB-like predicted nucleotidyltransferase (UPF0157 family) [Rhodovulum iodosum]|uniref:GrpB-like predicted nucleotidyltransferase (UPF0157 family) n=1 Tax=Rhodovulum iodosum TaxID=68291 RepID=A0ABV3XMW5_9RHOB|nr:GrpB family protein [Rhodovulum robiginosum]RSK35803.1 hypothetical protein EJA01_05495 [Rhodovulum robiginosum]